MSLVSCGALNYSNSSLINSITPIVTTELLKYMKNYPSTISYINLINGDYKW